MRQIDKRVRLSADIGGTFTDLALTVGKDRFSHKILTTPRAPELAVLEGIEHIIRKAGVARADIDVFVHGTTLATNAIIERKGARTALITTAGFRDALEMAYEHRFEQYDVMIDKPPPLVPRPLRFDLPERIDARGKVLLDIDWQTLEGIIRALEQHDVRSLAIGFLHSYINPAHEQAVAAAIRSALPTVSVTLSSEVCPEIREYERLSTACANAYVQPIMAGYLGRLENMARETGLTCPIYLMTSGGGLTSIDLARRFPIRLVESGPAGGAILAARVAQECKLDRVLSFDMGGTTAKICLIDDFEPQHARTFEVARQYRFQKGSGLPLRIPVIEMVEIGAGGGSIARVDNLQRITVGPDSAASEPGPACYGRGGTNATVTDADTVLGRIDPGRFAGGTISLNPEMSKQAICHAVAKPLEVDVATAAFGICEVVEENMANAARVHAVERGKELGDRTLVAFGGAAPLHAARLAEKIGIGRVVVPSGAGVGSAVGFLDAPVAFELVRSRYMRLSEFDPTAVAAMFSEMRSQAEAIVRPGAMNAPLSETRTADMRYRGQGHEITVFLPVRPCSGDDKTEYQHLFESAYEKQFGRTIPGLDIEIISWSTRLSAFDTAAGDSREARTNGPMALTQVSADLNAGVRRVYDPRTGEFAEIPLYWRDDLTPGDMILGPAIIAEAETSTFVTASFSAHINLFGYIVLDRIGGHGRPA